MTALARLRAAVKQETHPDHGRPGDWFVALVAELLPELESWPADAEPSLAAQVGELAAYILREHGNLSRSGAELGAGAEVDEEAVAPRQTAERRSGESATQAAIRLLELAKRRGAFMVGRRWRPADVASGVVETELERVRAQLEVWRDWACQSLIKWFEPAQFEDPHIQRFTLARLRQREVSDDVLMQTIGDHTSMLIELAGAIGARLGAAFTWRKRGL